MKEHYIVPEGVPTLTSKRWILAYTAIVGFFFLYCVRTNISVAIVCMVKSHQLNLTDTNLTTVNRTQIRENCALEASKAYDTAEFYWDKSIQSAILSSFFYGYIVLQVPGGWLAGRFGGKRVLGYMFVVNAVSTLLVPVCARVDYRIVMALRVILGVSSSVTYPAMQAMWGVWAPPLERSRLASFTYSGSLIGNIVTFSVSGLLCEYGFDNGWGSIFYLIGGGTFLWACLWMYVAADSPSVHPTITEVEKRYIIDSIGDHPDQQKGPTPWKKLLLCRANWSCFTAHFCNNWMHYTLMTSLPTFMKNVLKFDIKQNGLLSAVPYMAFVVVSISGGHAADYLRKHYLSTRFVRRSFQASSFLVSAACLVGVGFVTCENRYVAVALLTTAVGVEGLVNSGFMVNTIDFAPRYAGLLFGINNSIATIPGMVAPLIAGALTPNDTPEEWRNVFYVCSAIIGFGAIVFGLTAQTDLESWARSCNDVDRELHVKEKTTPIADEAFQDNDKERKAPIQNGVSVDSEKEKGTPFVNEAFVNSEKEKLPFENDKRVNSESCRL